MTEHPRSFKARPFEEHNSESRESKSVKREQNTLVALQSRAVGLLSQCSYYVPASLADEIERLPVECEAAQLATLLSHALDLLSRSSRYVLENLKDEIERLAHDTGRTTLMSVRVERMDDMVVIDPYNIAG